MANKFLSNINLTAGLEANGDSGTLDQVLTSTETGIAWVDPSTISAEAATLVVIECKNTSGATITKGTPVYQTGTVGATDVIEIAPADALISSGKQPAIGLLQTTLNDNGFGKVVITGEFLNFTTDPIDGVTPTTGQKVFLKSGGGLTLTKPTGAENGIQNLGLIGKVSGGNAGSITVSSIMRTNDVPNLTTGKIWVGDGNTVESTVVHLDEVNGRMGIGTTSPGAKLEVAGNVKITDGYLQVNSTAGANVYASPVSKSVEIWAVSSELGGDPAFRIRQDSTTKVDFGWDDDGTSEAFIWNYSNGGFKIGTNGSERFKITSTGNVGIGTTGPGGKLHIHQTGSGTNNSIITEDDARKIFIGRDSIKATDLSDNPAELYIQQHGGNATFGSDVSLGGNLTLTTNARYLRAEDSAGTTTRLLGINGSNTTYIGPIDAYAGGSIFYGVSANVSAQTFYTGASARMHINATGNVGIGTTNPNGKLDVNGIVKIGNVTTGLSMNGSSATEFLITGADTGGNAWNSIHIKADGDDGLFIEKDTNNVGIGTTSPGAKLDVAATTDAVIRLTSTGDGLGADTALGSLQFYGNDASVPGAGVKSSIVAKTESTLGDDSNLIFSTSDGTTNDVERMRITAGGVLMVGGTTGGYAGTKIHVGNFTDTQNGINVLSSTTGYGYLLFGDGTGADTYRGQITYYHGDDSMIFNTNGSEKLRIVSGGGISFAGATNFGSAGQVLKSNGSASPAWVDASTVIGGPYLPLEAGSSYPLTGTLYIGNVGGDQKIQFQRTGGNVYSIEHDSAQLYFYNRTTTETPLLIQNNGDVLMNAGNVGIGTTSPTHLLNLSESDSNSVQLVIDNTNTTDAGTETSEIRFRHYRSYVAGQNDAGEIIVGKEQAWDAAGDRNSYMAFGTRKGSDAVVEKMRITSSGNVGIGTEAPSTNLDILGASDTYLTIRNTGGGFKSGIRMYGGSSGISNIWHDDTEANPPGIHFGASANIATTPTTQLYIKGSNGNVGIGITAPSTKLDVAGNANISDTLAIGSLSTVPTASLGRALNIQVLANSSGTTVAQWLDIDRTITTDSTSAATWGMVLRNASTTTSTANDGKIYGAQIIGRHQGTGGIESAMGVRSTADINTTGTITTTGTLWGSYNEAQVTNGSVTFANSGIFGSASRGQVLGSGTVNITSQGVVGGALIGVLNNVNAAVNRVVGGEFELDLQNGTTDKAHVVSLNTFNIVSPDNLSIDEFAYIYLGEDVAIPTTITDNAYFIKSLTSLPSELAGSIEATSFIKTGGTSSQFLKADGSIDSTSYAPATGGSYLPLAGGTMTGDTKRGDNIYSYWGDSDDLAIYHLNGASSIYDRGAGNLNIFTNGGSIGLRKDTGENMLIANIDGSVDLYYDNSKKLATTSAGVNVTGEGYSTGGWGFGTGETPVGKIFNNSGVFAVRAETGRQISFGNVTNGEFMRINATGNVGIGTTNPGAPLVISNSSTDGLEFHNSISSSSRIISYKRSNDTFRPLRLEALSHVFGISGNEKMRIDSAGNLGIGTTSPSEKLDVVGNIELNGVLYIGSRGIYQQQNTDVSGLELVANASINLYRAAFFDYVIQKQGNVRAGTVFACNDGGSVEYTETSTNDIGDTSDVVLSVDISGTNMRLLADAATSGWSVKSLIRAI